MKSIVGNVWEWVEDWWVHKNEVNFTLQTTDQNLSYCELILIWFEQKELIQ